jgi:enoyl-CoA hydratase/carnithine racemase
VITSDRRFGDDVVTVTIDRPANRNALSTPVVERLLEHLSAAAADPSVRAIVLTGTGGTFCAGADLKDPPDERFPELFQQVLTVMTSCPKPIVARVAGHVRAGGIGLVAASDVVICAREATFAFSEVRVGVVPAFVAVLVTRSMSQRHLRDFILTGRRFSPAEAEASGLVTAVVDLADLDDRVTAFLDEVRAANASAVGRAKELLSALSELSVADGYSLVAQMSAEQFRSPAARAAQRAFAGDDRDAR